MHRGRAAAGLVRIRCMPHDHCAFCALCAKRRLSCATDLMRTARDVHRCVVGARFIAPALSAFGSRHHCRGIDPHACHRTQAYRSMPRCNTNTTSIARKRDRMLCILLRCSHNRSIGKIMSTRSFRIFTASMRSRQEALAGRHALHASAMRTAGSRVAISSMSRASQRYCRRGHSSAVHGFHSDRRPDMPAAGAPELNATHRALASSARRLHSIFGIGTIGHRSMVCRRGTEPSIVR